MVAKRLISNHSPKYGRLLIFIGIILTSALVAWYISDTMAYSPPAAYMLMILISAALLWSTEIIPLFATSLLIIGTQIILLSNPGGWVILEGGSLSIPYREFLNPLTDPIIFLFLGGFILAKMAVKAGVDTHLSSIMLKVFGLSAKNTLMGVIIITTIFGMWISNTAITAMMITLNGTLLAFVPVDNPFRKGLT